VVGTTCSFIGVFVVLRACIRQLGPGPRRVRGVALGFPACRHPLFTAVIFCLGTAGLIRLPAEGADQARHRHRIFFAFTMALGVVFIGLMKRYDARVYGYLFGNVLGITPAISGDAGLAAVVIGTVVVLYKEFKFLSFDEETAQASGLPTAVLSFLLLVLLALTVVVS